MLPDVSADSDFKSAYAGITLGYAFGGDDDIGVRPPGVDIGSAELSGWNAGLRLGYRWQRDRWVVGPEIAYVGGDISDDFDFGVGGEFVAYSAEAAAALVEGSPLVEGRGEGEVERIWSHMLDNDCGR